MKSHLFICAVILSSKVIAQQPYPTAGAIPQMQKLEYFVDTDPGINNGKQVTIPAASNIVSFNFQADLSGLSTGFHRLYVRTTDASGHISLTNNIFFDNFILPGYPAATPASTISAMEYFIDTDPGVNKAKPISITPGVDITAPFVADVTGLTAGVHRVYVRSRDLAGNWSLTSLGQFDNTAAVPYPSAPPPAPPIGEMEYYIDTDPGFGNGTKITFTPGTDISNFSVNIPLNTVSQGSHTFYIRSRQNPWSFSAYVPFLYSSTLPVVWSYVKGEIKTDKSYIDWATVNEQDALTFFIEYSASDREFVTVGEVKAAGNSSTTKQYQFIHAAPAKGMNYYRIRQVDKNGDFTYSKTLQLLYHPDKKELLVAPNPATDQLYVISSSGKNVTKAELFDMSGKQVYVKQLNAGQQVYSLDISSIQKGVYILKLYEETGVTTHRVLKQ
jgi:hypothetical protein